MPTSDFNEINNISDADAVNLTDGSNADSLHVHDADNVDYNNATSGLTATKVRGAIDEVESRVDTLEGVSHTQNTDTKLDEGGPNELTAAETRTHLDNLTKHRLINDASTSTNELWSSDKIQSELVASAEGRAFKGGVLTDSFGLGNITLSGEQTLNGELTSSDIVILIEQTSGAENGPWLTNAGAWTRPDNFNAPGEAVNGATWSVTGLTSTSKGVQWTLTNEGTIIIDTTPLTFVNDRVFEFGSTAGKATEGNDSRIPTQDENDALVGTDGTPSTANKYVTNSDSRLHVQNTDTKLDEGGPNELTAAETRTHLDDLTKHRLIDDVTPSADTLYSGNKIEKELDNVATLTSGATIPVDGVNGENVFELTLSVNGVLNNPTNLTDGKDYEFLITVGVAAVTLGYGANYDFVGGVPELSTQLGAKDKIKARFYASLGKLVCTYFNDDSSNVLNIPTKFSMGFGEGELPAELANFFKLQFPTGRPPYFTDRLQADNGRNVTMSGSTVKDIYLMSDFPAPSGGVITLEANTTYILHETLVTSDRFVVPDDVTVNFVTVSFNIDALVYTGTGTFFTGLSIGSLNFFKTIISLTDSSAIAFNIKGSAITLSQLALIESLVIGGSSVGTVEGLRFFENSSAIVDAGELTLLNIRDSRMIASLMIHTVDTSGGNFLRVNGTNKSILKINDVSFQSFASESIFNIRPEIGDDSGVRIESSSFSDSLAAPYKSGSTGAITVFADAAISSTSITSVTDSSGVARFNFTGPTVYAFQKVTISGFITNTAYNVTGIITATDGTTFFEISSIAFGTDEAVGAFVSDSVTVTSTAHGLSNGQGVLILNTLNYDGGSPIYNSLTNSFQINRAFVATETGDWDTGSLDQTERRVTSDSNLGIADSENIGSFTAQDNSTATVINTQDVFEDLNLNGLGMVLANNELWKIIDTTTLEMKYIGEPDFSGELIATIASVSIGGSNEFHFQVVINDVDVSGVISPDELGTTMNSTGLKVPVDVVTGDRVRIRVLNHDGISNITIRYLTGIIS